MPGTATAPISRDVLDDDGKVVRTIAYQPGEHISDEDADLLSTSHPHSFVPIAHNEHSCPSDCPDDSHRTAKPDERAVRVSPPPRPAFTPEPVAPEVK